MTATLIFFSVIYYFKEIWLSSSSYYAENIHTIPDRLIITFINLLALFAYYSPRFPKWLGGAYKARYDLDNVIPFEPTFQLTPTNTPSRIPQSFTGDIMGFLKVTVAVIVPTLLNTEKDMSQLKRLLESLAWQSRVPNIVIVVDDGSKLIYKESEIRPDGYDLSIEVLRLKINMGPAAARNRGVRLATKYNPLLVMFTDHDCIPESDWIQVGINAFCQSKQTFGNENFILSGQTRSYENTWFDFYHNIFGTLNGRYLPHDNNSLLYGTTCNLAIPFCLALRVPFEEDFKNAGFEDIDLCVRARKMGARTWFVVDMKVIHDFGYLGPPKVEKDDGELITAQEGNWEQFKRFFHNLRRFWLQFCRYGEWEPLMNAKHPEYIDWFNVSKEIHSI
ncbi:hypothetical protein G9A89_019229 [Geosiphon pyriformis]|nr:hypothetical protein G9A89_019229 [Geosiphon pyriformis]